MSDHDTFRQSLSATAPMGGEGMDEVFDADELGAVMDGDGGDDGLDPRVEDVEDEISHLDELDRVIVAGNALASLSEEHATVAVLEWLGRVGGDVRAVVAKEAIQMLAGQLAAGGQDVDEAYAGLVAVLARVGEFSAVMMPAEAE